MNIKSIRKLYMMSQAQFAKRFHLSVRTLQQWEQGKSEPNPALVRALYEIYIREHPHLSYEIYHKDTLVYDILLSSDKKNVFCIRHNYRRFLQLFPSEEITTYDLYRFFKSRCYEDGRDRLQEILAEAGMTDNNPYEWVDKTHGVTWEDYFWIKKKDEVITWKDVRVRE